MNVIGKRAKQSERLEAIKLGKTWCKNAPYLAVIYSHVPNPEDWLNKHHDPYKALSQAAFRVFIDFLDIETQIGLTKQLEGTEDAKRQEGHKPLSTRNCCGYSVNKQKAEYFTKIVNGKSMVIIFKNKFKERDPGDLANGGIERGGNQSSAGAQLRQGKERAATVARVLEIDIRRFGAFPIGKREILHAWISERLQASKWLK